jgi:protein gp37
MPDGTVAICYAEALAENGVAKPAYPHGFKHHYFRPSALKELKKGADPKLIFPDSMSDMFGRWIPRAQLTAVLAAMAEAPQHTFMSLTKAAPQIRKYIDLLPFNLWVGVSSAPDWMEGRRLDRNQQERFTDVALKRLWEVKERTGNITWMSLEPVSWDMAYLFKHHSLDFVVIGAATNGNKKFQPDPVHVLNLLEVFDDSNTPVFYKGNITETIDWLGIRFREDFPTHYHDGRPIPAVFRRQQLAIEHGWPTNTFIEGGMVAPPVPSTGQLALL